MRDNHDDLDTEQSGGRPNSLLRADILGDLVGVIDLKDGAAVHAVAGQRSQYRRVEIFDQPGDPQTLANHYWSLGLRRLYVADLDGIDRGVIQTTLLERLLANANRWDEILLDLGCGDAVTKSLQHVGKFLKQSGAMYRMILATESAKLIDHLPCFTELISPTRLLIGLDYRDGVFVSEFGDERRWVQAATELGIGGAVVLDVASVGTGDSAAAVKQCRKLKSIDATFRLYSGGGIRSGDDVQALRNAGCDRFLVATALHRLRS